MADDNLMTLNNEIRKQLCDILKRKEADNLNNIELLAQAYAALITLRMMHYDIKSISDDALAAAEKLMSYAQHHTKKICKNKDENGSCPLHNLHCQYPDCES